MPRASLLALAFGNFVIGTGTLIVPGMLPQLAEGIGVSLAAAAQLITAFAATVCVAAPLLAGATSRYDRRALLTTMQLVFTSQAASAAALLVAPEQRGRAIAFVFLGWPVAAVLGLPLGAYIGASLGWQAGFALVAALAAAAAAALWGALPAGLRVAPVNGAMWRAILSSRAQLAVIAVSALFMAANFALFSYLVPAAGAFIDAAPAEISLLFAALGAASIFGNTLTARFMDRVGAGNVVLCCMAAVLAGHLAWPWSAGHPALLMAAVSVWGLGFAATLSAQQARLAALSPAQAPVSIALNSSATYLGQAVGTAAGGSVIGHVSGAAGYASLAGLSVPLILAAAAVSLFVAKPFPRKEPA